MAEPAPTHAGFVAIVGAPNVGKSTLLNRLVGSKVSIVSSKVQTTRRRIIGITIQDGCQVMFVDTPGIFAPSRRLESAMVRAASAGIADADLVLLLLDVRKGIDANARLALAQLERERRRAFLVINKIDQVSPDKALPLIQAANAAYPFDETFIVSALDGDGCTALMSAVVRAMPEGPWLFPEDQLSDLSDRALAAEITREQIFHRLHQELPYSITVETEGWAEAPDGSEVRIDQTIYALRSSQKPILIGKKGQQLKAIGAAARAELEQVLGKRVHLFLFVKIRENWLDDPERYREMGLDFER